MEKTYYVIFDTEDFKKGNVVRVDKNEAKDHPELMLYHVALRNGLIDEIKNEVKVKKTKSKKIKRKRKKR